MAKDSGPVLVDRDIQRITRELGAAGLKLVQQDPYVASRLFPLKKLDALARALGISERGNVSRAIAVGEYALDKALLNGDCYLPAFTVLHEARDACRFSRFTAEDLTSRGTIVVSEDGKTAMLAPIFAAEQAIAAKIIDLCDRQCAEWDAGELAQIGDLELDVDQQQAIRLLYRASIGVVTGPPGVGKTTCTRTALDLLDAEHVSYVLCAPTGKAARRMHEVTGRPASTIHRLLGSPPTGFRPNADNPLPCGVVIVDESSMIDVRLAADLLAAVGSSARIIFIGDENQLPPVGPGAFFSDLIASDVVPVVHLKTLHRAAKHSWIYRNAQAVLAGRGVELDADVPDYTWYELEEDQAGEVGTTVMRAVAGLLSEGRSWDEFQVIAPKKVGASGTIELNKQLHGEFSADGQPKITIGAYEDSHQVCRGDRVIQTKNDYELGIFNGECGEIAVVEHARAKLRFNTEYQVYKGVALRNLAPSYALTVHRVQGSEWPIVIVCVHSVYGRMLNRRLFYTAITRAKSHVILIGDERGVMQAIKSTQDSKRRTGLTSRRPGAA